MFFTQLNKSQAMTLQSKFDSKETYSLTKSATTVSLLLTKNESFLNGMKVQHETRAFYTEIERLYKKKTSKLSGGSNQAIPLSPTDPRADIKTIRNIIFNELDELFVPFNEIEVGKLIGKGATSEVYIGQFKFSQVAIKKVRLASLAPKQLMNIVYEMKFLRKMRHPNIITLYGVTVDANSNVYIVTELCEQQSLKSFFRKFKDKIPNKVKHKIIFDIAKALNHIHSDKPGLIHRDIKPENIFLTSDLKAKLGDFGIAKHTDGSDLSAGQSPGIARSGLEQAQQQTDTIATLQYMAPECLTKGNYTSGSDIYAFGVLSWELLHERDAYEGMTEFTLVNSVMQDGHCLKFDESTEPEISELLQQCMRVNIDERPSARQVCSKLAEFLKPRK